MIDATRPARSIPDATFRAIDLRFKEWMPWAKLSGLSVTTARSRHLDVYVSLLSLGLSPLTIKRKGFDDPRITDVERSVAVRKYLDKRHRRAAYGSSKTKEHQP